MNVPRVLIERGWNKRPLTFSDFESLCSEHGVLIQWVAMKTPGMFFVCEGQPFISLSKKLQGVLLWIVAWHEFAHYLLHPPGLRCFTNGTVNKIEEEAQSIALCCVIDEHTLFRILAHGELHDIPRKILEARARVLDRYKV